jgi:predicted TIM-barrel fold metal-dependent hydrolase
LVDRQCRHQPTQQYAPGVRIDAHAHLFPPEFIAESDRHGGIPWPAALPDLDACLSVMDRYETDACVLSLPLRIDFAGQLSQSRAADLARRCNIWFAEAVQQSPTRVAALGCLPLPDVEAALDEAAFCLDELRLDGVIMLSSYDGCYLGHDRFDSLFEELDRRGTYVFVHPTATGDPLGLPFGPFLTELPFDTTRAVVNLLFSGTMSQHAGIRFQFAHLGGAALYLATRIDEALQRVPELRQHAPRGCLHLRDAFWDTGLSAGAPPLAAAIAAVGPERVVFGTDWPFDTLRPHSGRDPAPGLDCIGADRLTVDETALSLVPRLARSGE